MRGVGWWERRREEALGGRVRHTMVAVRTGVIGRIFGVSLRANNDCDIENARRLQGN
jgi:hypothetical protein